LEYLGYAEQNRQEWAVRGESVVADMNREVRAKLLAAQVQQHLRQAPVNLSSSLLSSSSSLSLSSSSSSSSSVSHRAGQGNGFYGIEIEL
jgi:hypothetical protein